MVKIISYWKDFNHETKPFIHDKDKIILEKHQDDVNSHEDFLNLNYYGTKKNKLKYKLHLNLLPEPYAGDITNATIYVLLLNPGYSNSNYYEENESSSDFRKDFIRTIRQEFKSKDKYPLIWLNPKYLWTAGGIWMENKFKPLLEYCVQEKGYTYVEALKLISKKVAILELFPYHSESFGVSSSDLELESVKRMRDFVIDTVVDKAIKNKACVIQTRSIYEWKLKLEDYKDKDKCDNIIVFDSKHRRSASLGRKSASWAKMKEFLFK